MRISFCCSDTKPQPWVDGLKAAFPEADVTLWAAGDAPADYAVVWRRPSSSLTSSRSSRASSTSAPASMR
jgi:hypothetical protein